MKNTRLHLLLVFFSLMGIMAGLICNMPGVKAAFGTSPPWVKNDHMLPGTSFEQVINLSRSESDKALQAAVRLSGDEKLLEWITIEDMDNLILKKGQAALPMKVTVNVPKMAEIKQYIGSIFVSLSPVKTDTTLSGGEVAITLGANILVDITVIGDRITDYRVQSVTIDPLHEDEPFTLQVEIENLGNTQITGLEGTVDIYDSKQTELIKSLPLMAFSAPVSPDAKVTRRMVYLDEKLTPGDYWFDVKVIKDGEVEYENRFQQKVEPKVVPVVTPEFVSSASKPALPGAQVQEGEAEKELTEVNENTTPEVQIVELRPAADESESNKFYLIFGMAGLGLGLIALIGIIVVLVVVIKNQQRAAVGQYPGQVSFPVQPTVPMQTPTPIQPQTPVQPNGNGTEEQK